MWARVPAGCLEAPAVTSTRLLFPPLHRHSWQLRVLMLVRFLFPMQTGKTLGAQRGQEFRLWGLKDIEVETRCVSSVQGTYRRGERRDRGPLEPGGLTLQDGLNKDTGPARAKDPSGVGLGTLCESPQLFDP